MSLEKYLSDLNEFFFFKEFTYTKNLFRKKDGQEIEVADNILAIDDLYIVFQLKERDEGIDSTPEEDEKWFEKKVIKKATKQIRDTIGYFKDYDDVCLTNNQGDSFNLAVPQVSFIHKVVIYRPGKSLAEKIMEKKYHISNSVGVIHIIADNDYLGIVQYLILK